MKEENAIFCCICLELGSWPKARPEICKHTFCYPCINAWVKRRSECPLCKRPANRLVVLNQDGTAHKISVKGKISAQYQIEIDDEHDQETEDISVLYARCQVCTLSKDEHLLLLCDGIIGQNVDGSSIRCNAACHCYCLPEKLDSVPDGDWFCPFCANKQVVRESIGSSLYTRRRHQSATNYQQFMNFQESGIVNEDQPGPSGINQSVRLRSHIDTFHSDKFSMQSSSGWDQKNESDDGMESDSNFSLNTDSVRSTAISNIIYSKYYDVGDDWDNQDSMVLATDSGYDAGATTEVTRRNRRSVKKKSKKKKKRRGIRKRNVKRRSQSGYVFKRSVRRKNRRRKNVRKRKDITGVQRRLAEAVGLNPLTGRQKKRKKTEQHLSSKCIRWTLFNTSVLSIRRGDDLDIPIDSLNLQSTEYLNDQTSGKKYIEKTDLITSIMLEQAKTLAPARYQRILRDGTIGETEQVIKQRKKLIDEGIMTSKQLVSSKAPKDSNENISMYSPSSSYIETKEKRKRRPSRWGTPTTSKCHDNSIVTASIPLPLEPPLTQLVSLESIPVPSTEQQPQSVTLPSRPSAHYSNPSTSFALKSTSIPSFGIASGQRHINLAPFAGSGLGQQSIGLSQQSLVTLGQQQLTNLGQQTLAGLGQQPLPGLNQPQLTSIGQGSLVQMQPSLLPNFFLPPLNLNAMNGLLAAGLLANNNTLGAPPITQTLAQPSSATTTPFMLNPMQLSTASAQQLNHFVNLAATLRRNTDADSAHFSEQPPKHLEGVPPPPPVIKPSESTSSNLSLCEPLAEKIRKLIEASNVRPLGNSSVEDGTAKIDFIVDDETNNVMLCDGSRMGELGRRSASADEEETSEAVRGRKYHKNGAMFEEARRMLSSSLKKVYRLKQITKQEYKEIMKKGVTALSQRTKLDQRKVDEYAAKYVECVIHRRKKRH